MENNRSSSPNSCAIVRDLLPLVHDGICSEESQAYVSEHLAQCPDCRTLLEKLQDSSAESTLEAEKETALRHQYGFVRRKSAIAGCILAAILLVPVLICLIVNLASGHALNWFFIVLSALLLSASLSVVPLLVPENRFFWTLTAGSASLLLLLGVCCLYTGGNWFWVAASACLFGIVFLFLPFAVRTSPLRGILGGGKSLCVLLCDTVTFIAMMTAIGFFVRVPVYPRMAAVISLPFVLFAWILFAVIRYAPVSGWTRAGLCTAVSGAFVFLTPTAIELMLGSSFRLPVFRVGVWNNDTINDNILWLCLTAGLVLGIVFVGIGFLRARVSSSSSERKGNEK